MKKNKEKQSDVDIYADTVNYGSSRTAIVRATFRLSESCIDAISILSAHWESNKNRFLTI